MRFLRLALTVINLRVRSFPSGLFSRSPIAVVYEAGKRPPERQARPMFPGAKAVSSFTGEVC
jgi:hypothetical protein